MVGRRGHVWSGDRLVGHLRENEESHICFSYDPDWLDGDGFPISISLPLSYGDEEVKAHAWFTGLLPEGDARTHACDINGVDESDNMGLLLAIGADCAGALSVLPTNTPSINKALEPSRVLTVDELISLVNSYGIDMPAFPDGGTRFSLSGAQRKLAVRYDNGTYSLSTRTKPSSHILKFETRSKVCFAEYISNAIAREAGLPVVNTEYLQTNDSNEQTPWLRISRYDRARDKDDTLFRLYQEDMLQALRLNPIHKYQSDYGPTVGAIAQLLQSHAVQPAVALSTLLDWQILNYLLGNWDGHAKNLSLLYQPGQAAPMLAPCYDMVSIEYLNQFLLNPWNRDMALFIGENTKPERITRTDWEIMAEELGMPPKRVLERLEEKATNLPDLAEQAIIEFTEQHGGRDDYYKLQAVVDTRCRQVLNSVSQRNVKKTDQDTVTENNPDTESRKSNP